MPPLQTTGRCRIGWHQVRVHSRHRARRRARGRAAAHRRARRDAAADRGRARSLAFSSMGRRARSALRRSVPSTCARTRPPTDSSPPPPSPAGATPTSRSDSVAASVCRWASTPTSTARRSPKGAGARPMGLDDFAYVTVGTGIGVGTIVRGTLGVRHESHGARTHPRGAQTRRQICRRLSVSRRLHRRPRFGSRPSKRAPACPPRNLPPDHPAWEFVAHGLGAAHAHHGAHHRAVSASFSVAA